MEEMKDYSGPFNPNLKKEDLSKELLLKLFKAYQEAYLIVLTEWHRVMRERFGEVQAIECDNSMWMVAGPLINDVICKALNIKPDDVEGYFKRRQLDIGFPLSLFDIEWELVNPKLGYMTIKRCTALDSMEELGQGYELPLCHIDENPTAQASAFFHNPNLIFRPVKLPPRKSKDDIPCKFEVRIVKPDENPFPFFDMSKRMPGVAHDPKEASKPWSEEQIRVMWGYLTKPTRDVMRVIAKKPDGCLEEDIIRELGISSEEVAFRLQFIYLAIFETPWPQKWAPVRFVLNPWRYEMDKEWAQAIPQLPV